LPRKKENGFPHTVLNKPGRSLLMNKKLKKYDAAAMDELRKQAAGLHVSDGEKIPMELLEKTVGGERLTN
jgi:hypothetical protein